MTIDWRNMPHGVFAEEGARFHEERSRRIEELEALAAAQPRIETRGRKPRTNGGDFPEHARGALDTAGEA